MGTKELTDKAKEITAQLNGCSLIQALAILDQAKALVNQMAIVKIDSTDC